MFGHPAFGVEPWRVTEEGLHLDILAQSESVFALSNGHIGLRGNLDEGEPHGIPGTYLNSVYELRPLPYAEAGYGYPESGQTVVNVTNAKIIRLLVEDEPFDVRYGRVLSHRRELDLRAGLLTRQVDWISPARARVRVRSVRMVSLVQRAVMAVHYSVEAVDQPIRVVVQSELVANEQLPPASGDPRVSAVLEAPLRAEGRQGGATAAFLMHRVNRSGLRVAVAMDHQLGPPGRDVDVSCEVRPDVARVTMFARLDPGAPLSFTKLAAYGWSAQRSRPAVHDQVEGALVAARLTGWEGLLAEQRAFLDDFWARADVEVGGDPEIQQAVRFGMFHALQAGARAERRPVPAKGLTGPGYDGHAFWDGEIFVHGLLSFTVPEAVADALRWRHSTLPAARSRARQLDLDGAVFPWRTINGEECSAYWPAGTAAFHIAADIAYAVVRYVRASGDDRFEREVGIDLLVETARMWRSLGHYEAGGTFRIDGVTGPDEYSAVADNNVYTNLMAQLNLQEAAAAVARHPVRAGELGVGEDEAETWLEAAGRMYLPYDRRLGVHPQAEGFTGHQRWDFEATGPERYPLMLHYPYFELYRKQVVKQADLVLALHLRGEAFSPEDKARDFEYYEAITVRDSSLSACTQAIVAAEVGHLELAHAYLAEAALVDLDDLEHNTRDGLHIASLAGAWNALVKGLGGMRVGDSGIAFSPRLPPALDHLAFSVVYRGRQLRVEVGRKAVTYRLVGGGAAVALQHHGRPLRLEEGGEVTAEVPPAPHRAPPSQPPGRSPALRRPAGSQH